MKAFVICLWAVISVCSADVSLNYNAVPIYSLPLSEGSDTELTREYVAFAGQTQFLVPAPAPNRQYLPPGKTAETSARVIHIQYNK